MLRTFLIKIGDFFYYHTLESELKGIKLVLDVGCGSSSPIGELKKTFHSVGVDIFKPSIEKSKKKKIHDEYITGDILKMSSFVKPKSFDAIIALDIIEHLTKNDGFRLLKQMERAAKKKVIVFTPNGFTEQHPYEENPYQKHKSGWSAEDFAKEGYTVYGMRGIKWIRGECATIKFKPWIFWGFISTITQPLVYRFPRIAYQLLAVKQMKNTK